MIGDAELRVIPAVGLGAAAIQPGADPVAAGDQVGHVVFRNLLAHLPGEQVAQLPPSFRPLPVELPQVGGEHLQSQFVMVDGRAQERPPHSMGQGEDLANIVKKRGHHSQIAGIVRMEPPRSFYSPDSSPRGSIGQPKSLTNGHGRSTLPLSYSYGDLRGDEDNCHLEHNPNEEGKNKNSEFN